MATADVAPGLVVFRWKHGTDVSQNRDFASRIYVKLAQEHTVIWIKVIKTALYIMCSLVLGYIGSLIHLRGWLSQVLSICQRVLWPFACPGWLEAIKHEVPNSGTRGASGHTVVTTLSLERPSPKTIILGWRLDDWIQLHGLNQLAEATLFLECSYERSERSLSPDSPDASFQVHGAFDHGVGILRPELRSTAGKFRIQPSVPGRRRNDPWHCGHGRSRWERKPRKGWPGADEALPGGHGGDVPGAADAFPARDPRGHPALGMHWRWGNGSVIVCSNQCGAGW